MPIAYWVLIGAVFVVALLAFARARRLSKRLKRLTESYWDLRYELGQLQARVKRLEPEQPDHSTGPASTGATPIIPLSSLKR